VSGGRAGHLVSGKSMKITREEVEHVAKLARLELKAQELETFGRQLSEILTYIDKLNELDTSGVEPMSHAVGVMNVFREDETGKSLDVEEALGNAPARQEGFFRVPKVLG
jgi:aspartyl-tRNA(Asn)/glutamyl-tRNA(Gln) amidotransferase subunit C